VWFIKQEQLKRELKNLFKQKWVATFVGGHFWDY